jgi:hypothetical protein
VLFSLVIDFQRKGYKDFSLRKVEARFVGRVPLVKHPPYVLADAGESMDYLTTSRVARELGVSEAAVRKMADAGTLPVAAKLSEGNRISIYVAGAVKTVVVASLARVPSYRAQRLAASVVRFVWPTFGKA